MRELGKVTAEIKGKMMTAGTIMISYQPLGEYPNFFRSIISNQVKIIWIEKMNTYHLFFLFENLNQIHKNKNELKPKIILLFLEFFIKNDIVILAFFEKN